MKKRFYDLHCDTATRAFALKTGLKDGRLHINEEALRVFDEVNQVFAVFYDERRTDDGMEFFFNVKALLEKEAPSVKGLNPILSCEGGNVTKGDLNNIALLAENGVKFFSLVWNGTSCFATGGATDQSKGLSPLGRDCLKELKNCGIVLDVSHLSDEGFAEVEALSKETFVATHSNARSVCNHGRNLTDKQIKTIAERHGLIGLNLNPPFLNWSGAAGAEDIIRHVDKMLELGGERVLALGCDLDGISDLPEGMTTVADLTKIRESLADRFGTATAENIFYNNAYDFFNKHIH